MEWQPIETAPKDGRDILLFMDGEIYRGAWYEHYWCGARFDMWLPEGHGEPTNMFSPSHWMPLPPPPPQTQNGPEPKPGA